MRGRRRSAGRARAVTPRLALAAALAALAAAAGAAEGPAEGGIVTGRRLLVPDGGRLDWSVQGDWIAYDRRGADGRYQLHRVRPDGTRDSCLTCPHLEFAKAHAFNPAWHPSGDYLVFQVQEPARRIGLSAAGLTTPDRGLHSDLWLVREDGRRIFQLTRSGQQGRTVVDPVFSYEGDRLAWSERVASRYGRWGEWVVRVARFEVKRGVPRLSKVETFEPGRGWVDPSGFSPDDRRLLVAGDFGTRGGDAGLDLFVLDLASGGVTRLTDSAVSWDEGARFSPTGREVAWTSSREIPPRPLAGQRDRRPSARPERRDLWLMAPDGSGAQRLTFFNHPDGVGPGGGAVVSDFAWSPDGDRLALHVVTDLAAEEEAIYLLELAPTLGRGREPDAADPSAAGGSPPAGPG